MTTSLGSKAPWHAGDVFWARSLWLPAFQAPRRGGQIFRQSRRWESPPEHRAQQSTRHPPSLGDRGSYAVSGVSGGRWCVAGRGRGDRVKRPQLTVWMMLCLVRSLFRAASCWRAARPHPLGQARGCDTQSMPHHLLQTRSTSPNTLSSCSLLHFFASFPSPWLHCSEKCRGQIHLEWRWHPSTLCEAEAHTASQSTTCCGLELCQS